MSKKFAVALKKARISLRKTQKELSEVCGTNPYTIKAWETGRSVPNYYNFDLIVKGLNDLGLSEIDLEELEEVYNEEKLGSIKNVW